MTGQPMLCAYCSTIKPWTSKNFPYHYYAQCAECIPFGKDKPSRLKRLTMWLEERLKSKGPKPLLLSEKQAVTLVLAVQEEAPNRRLTHKEATALVADLIRRVG